MVGLDAFRDTGFLLKFIALICNIVVLVFWVIKENNIENLPIDKSAKVSIDKNWNISVSAYNFSQLMLFYHCGPAFVVILAGFVILHVLDVAPGLWAQRIFCLSRAVFFIVFGVIGLVNAVVGDRDSHKLVVAALCALVGGLLCFDFVKRELC